MKKLTLILTLLIAGSAAWGQRFGATPEDSAECIKNISLYTEFYKQKNYVDAFTPWMWLYENCPQNHVNTFIRGNVILKKLIVAEKDLVRRDSLINLLLSTWDKRAEIYGRPDICLGRKALDMMQVRPRMTKEVYELLSKAIDMGAETDYVLVFYLFESAINNQKAGNMTKEEVIEVYDRSSSIFERLIEQNPEDTLIRRSYDNLEIAFEPYATCDELVPMFEKKFEANKTNVSFLKKVCKILDRKDCTDAEIFFKATEALYAVEPDVKAAYLMAKLSDGKKLYDKVIEYLKTNADKITTPRDKGRAFLLLARAYSETGRGSDARAAAMKVLEVTPNDGRAYILIGDAYAKSARSCGEDSEVGQKAAYWAAVDKFRQAKNADPSVAEIADKLIATYSAHFPTGDDLFMRGFSEGSSYRVGCWIQENTVVRKR